MIKLNKKQQSIIPVSAFTAKGDLTGLNTALHEGLDAGLAVNEIKEVLVQLYAYTGFPRSLNAITAFMSVLAEREQNGIKDETGKEANPLPANKSSLELGTEIQTRLAGGPVKGGAVDFAPAIGDFLKAHLFGDIFGRDNLDEMNREIATIAALSGLEGVEGQLSAHLRIGRNAGLTEEQIGEIAAVLEVRVGAGEAYRARKTMNSVFGMTFTDGEPIKDVFARGQVSSFDYFTGGEVYVQSLVPDDLTFNCPTSNVTFKPGARTRWHSHEEGQILLVTAGRGYYREQGEAARELRQGDIVLIRPDIVHWHGAASDSEFSHISIMPDPGKGKSDWLEPVSDEEYDALKQE
ncbi:MAG: carboxymuconolactone decarboxylase family protein [Bacteroidota bacterium]|nr:carboxymuconolactone decarboxylase family protein [Bacteroidota bacterium]